jgi:hypothetical protein
MALQYRAPSTAMGHGGTSPWHMYSFEKKLRSHIFAKLKGRKKTKIR